MLIYWSSALAIPTYISLVWPWTINTVERYLHQLYYSEVCTVFRLVRMVLTVHATIFLTSAKNRLIIIKLDVSGEIQPIKIPMQPEMTLLYDLSEIRWSIPNNAEPQIPFAIYVPQYLISTHLQLVHYLCWKERSASIVTVDCIHFWMVRARIKDLST